MEKDNINLIVELLTAWLRNKVNSDGMSQNRLAHQTHISQPTINSYINEGKLPGASLDYILRLFPELQRPILQVLEGHGVGPVHQEANCNTNSHINQTAGVVSGDGEALRAKIILSILDLDLPPEVQSQVLKVIKNA